MSFPLRDDEACLYELGYVLSCERHGGGGSRTHLEKKRDLIKETLLRLSSMLEETTDELLKEEGA